MRDYCERWLQRKFGDASTVHVDTMRSGWEPHFKLCDKAVVSERKGACRLCEHDKEVGCELNIEGWPNIAASCARWAER